MMIDFIMNLTRKWIRTSNEMNILYIFSKEVSHESAMFNFLNILWERAFFLYHYFYCLMCE